MSIVWESRYALRMRGVTSSTIREILKLTQRPEVISFAGGLPAAEYFPTERFQDACQRVLSNSAHQALQYSPTEGYPPLREFIAERLNRSYNIQVDIDNVMITSGSQQALSLLAGLMINPGDHILVEHPTYLGALQAFSTFQASYVSVPCDDNGICAEQVPAALRHAPKFMYILPNFQNPGGTTLHADRRQELVNIAEAHGVPIVEDDPYGMLRYDGEDIPSLLAFDAERLGGRAHQYDGNVIYLSTFSKSLAPGLRIAWVVGPPQVLARLVQVKQGADLHTSTFNQMVIYEVAKDGFIDEHVATLREVYRKRRDAMLGALDRFMPHEVRWTQPQGGLFLWMHFPAQINARELFEASVRRNVAFVPGDAFFTEPDPPPTARINFSCMDEAGIVEGIKRMAEAIEELLVAAQTQTVVP
ncbi:MAG: PLP-dependent aminotransferase family protein [Anaerolineae bacterium]|nr:PLP-dependent aminotransferase family protein [Anaerolineae bacterium]